MNSGADYDKIKKQVINLFGFSLLKYTLGLISLGGLGFFILIFIFFSQTSVGSSPIALFFGGPINLIWGLCLLAFIGGGIPAVFFIILESNLQDKIVANPAAIPILHDFLIDPELSHYERKVITQTLVRTRWEPTSEIDKIWYNIGLEQWHLLVPFGTAAIGPIISTIKKPSFRDFNTGEIAKIGTELIDPLLAILQKSDNAITKELSIKILSEFKDIRILSPIIHELAISPNFNVRSAAKDAIIKMNNPESINFLETALNEATDQLNKNSINEVIVVLKNSTR